MTTERLRALKQPEPIPLPPPPSRLLGEGIRLAQSLASPNTSRDRPLRILSPRFLSITPSSSEDEVAVMSPSVLSLHDKGPPSERAMSVPRLLGQMTANDRQGWLDLIFEASGINEQAHSLDKEEDQEKRKLNTWGTLVKSYSQRQLRELNSTGYSLLSKRQLHFLYGPNSPYNNSGVLERLNGHFHQMQELLHDNIHQLGKRRRKRQGVEDLSTFLAPTILAPVGAWNA